MPRFVPFEPAQHLARTRTGRDGVGLGETEADGFLLSRQIENVRMERVVPASERRFHLPQMIAKRVSDVRIRRRNVARDDKQFAQRYVLPAGVGRQAQRAEAERLERRDLLMRQTVIAFPLRRGRRDMGNCIGKAECRGQG